MIFVAFNVLLAPVQHYATATIPQTAFLFTAELDRWLFLTLRVCSSSKADNDCYGYNIIGLFFLMAIMRLSREHI